VPPASRCPAAQCRIPARARKRASSGRRTDTARSSRPIEGALSADLAPLRRVDDLIFNCISVLSTHPAQLIESIRVDSEFRHYDLPASSCVGCTGAAPRHDDRVDRVDHVDRVAVVSAASALAEATRPGVCSIACGTNQPDSVRSGRAQVASRGTSAGSGWRRISAVAQRRGGGLSGTDRPH
jgi:hypothetical protein